jgi:predicted DNA-binding protein (MmcQ/YjbR family)
MKSQAIDAATHRRLRAICLALPEVTETSSWGHPNWKVGKRIFAALEIYRGVLSICLKPSTESYRALAKDSRWYVTPYVGSRGWLSRTVDGSVDWKEIERCVRESFREHATARAIASLDTQPARARRAPAKKRHP